MRSRIFFWFLPIVDLFAMEKILGYYAKKGIFVPRSHALLATVERWAGYLPAGFLLGRWLGPFKALFIFLLAMLFAGPLEVLLMCRGKAPWRFLGGKGKKLLMEVFLLEGYNALGYFVLGAMLGTF